MDPYKDAINTTPAIATRPADQRPSAARPSSNHNQAVIENGPVRGKLAANCNETVVEDANS